MALIICPDCQKKISSVADACPHCGRPTGGRTTNAVGGRVQTVEQTGKKWKMAKIVTTIFMFVVVIYTVSVLMADGTGREEEKMRQVFVAISGTLLALLMHLYVKFMIWWHHK